MRNTVFLDNLPRSAEIVTPWHEQYRAARNLALTDMQVNHPDDWQDRACPACNTKAQSVNFSRTVLPFAKCGSCGTIFSTTIPSQSLLDKERLKGLPDRLKDNEPGAENARKTEFMSLINWISLSAARASKEIRTVLDFRFSSHANGWSAATQSLGHKFDWHLLPITNPGTEDVEGQVVKALSETKPDAITVFSEIDRFADPRGLLKSIHAHAPKGTTVFVATSCADGLEYQLLGSESPSFIPLDRLNLFSIKGFSGLAEETGYKVVEASTPGRLDAAILQRHFETSTDDSTPFWPSFFRDAQRDELQDLQVLLQRSRRSGVMRIILETV